MQEKDGKQVTLGDILQKSAMEEEALRQVQRLRDKLLKDEVEFTKKLEEREKYFSEKEKDIKNRIKNLDEVARQFNVRELKLKESLVEFEKEKERYSEENRNNLERKSKDYVKEAITMLDQKEKQFHTISKYWSAFGAISLVFGVGYFIYVSLLGANLPPGQVTWEFILYFAFRGLITIGLLLGLARYSFMYSSSYMEEALKYADRRHAINFGKFYLELNGAAADWTQVKEAFEHWNILRTNAFTRTKESSIDVTSLEKLLLLSKRIRKDFLDVQAEDKT